MDGPVVIPKLYDGQNKTFFMGAYEGLRGDAFSSPFNTVPTALMRQGNFSEIATPIRNPFTGQPFPGNIIPASLLSPMSQELLRVLPGAQPAGTLGVNNLQSQSATRDENDQLLVRGDQNVGNKVRLSVRYNWHDTYNSVIGAIPVAGDHAAPRQQEHAGVLHAHAEAEPVQRFPDRLPPHRLRHAEPLRGERHPDRRSRPRHSRLRR